ncbi:MAG: hypothetical protein K0S08_650 [Gammaproteobacteria bacterium]|jgi:DNA-directed RNA polymerase specialized sigma24 family protein|nr:hypothetical protein [Gammaproteobacteria bacterium]
MKYEPAYVDWLLKVWSYWEIRLASGGLGWMPFSSSAIPLDRPDFSTKEFGTRIPPFNEISDRMNYIINQELKPCYPLYAEALKAVYLTEEKKTMKEIAAELKISLTALKARIHEAKTWLDGRVRGDEFLQVH